MPHYTIPTDRTPYKRLVVPPQSIRVDAAYPRSSCKFCVQKHLGSAMVLASEAAYGYPHQELVIGHLNEAQEESFDRYPLVAEQIREIRHQYQLTGEFPEPDKIRELMMQMDAIDQGVVVIPGDLPVESIEIRGDACTKGKTIKCGKICRQPKNCKQKTGGQYKGLLAQKREKMKQEKLVNGVISSHNKKQVKSEASKMMATKVKLTPAQKGYYESLTQYGDLYINKRDTKALKVFERMQESGLVAIDKLEGGYNIRLPHSPAPEGSKPHSPEKPKLTKEEEYFSSLKAGDEVKVVPQYGGLNKALNPETLKIDKVSQSTITINGRQYDRRTGRQKTSSTYKSFIKFNA